MKDFLTFVVFMILVLSLAACQSKDDSSVVEGNDESSFTLNGAGE